MQLAQKPQDIDDVDDRMVPKHGKQKEALFGYQRIAKEVIASIEDRLEELTSRRTVETRPVMARPALRSWTSRSTVALLLAIAFVSGLIVWQAPRSDAARMMVARWAPQSVADWLLDRQDVAEAGSSMDNAQASSSYRGMGDNDAQNGVAAAIDQSEVLQRMARDIATLQQGIEQLRAGQDQMLRMMMRPTAGLNAQARTVVPPPRPVGAQQTTGLAQFPPPPPIQAQPRRPSVQAQRPLPVGPFGTQQ